jgi:presenilin-like A22 family membrane protease
MIGERRRRLSRSGRDHVKPRVVCARAGDGRDEYWSRLDIHATPLAGSVLIGVIIGMCLWEWGHGRDGSPYVQLGAIAGVAYLAALALLRWRA